MKKIEEYISCHRQEIIKNLCSFVRIPSIACQDGSGTPYGAECAKALDFCKELAESKNLLTRDFDYHCLEISLEKPRPNQKRLVIAAHADVVDVVEEDHIYPPFGGQIVGDYIVGRGAVDDKGPLMAALYAMAFFAENHIRLNHDIRLVAGSNEEMGMDDIEYYLAQEGQPDLGLAVDDDFPCVRGEKGLIHFCLSAEKSSELEQISTWGPNQRLIHNHAKITVCGQTKELVKNGEENFLAELIKDFSLLRSQKAQQELLRIAEDKTGECCKIALQDNLSGSGRLNLYSIQLCENQVKFYFDIRVPVTFKTKDVAARLEKYFADSFFHYELCKNSPGYYVDDQDEFMNLLTDLYNDVTGTQERPYVMSGCTYARLFDHGMGFGSGNPHEVKPFPKGHGGVHGADEAHNIDVLLYAVKMDILAIQAIDAYWTKQEQKGR